MPPRKRRRKKPPPDEIVVKRLPGRQDFTPRVGELPPEKEGRFDPNHFHVRRIDHEAAERHRQRILALPAGAKVTVDDSGSMADLIWRVEDVNGRTNQVTVVTTLFGVREERRTVPIERVQPVRPQPRYFSA